MKNRVDRATVSVPPRLLAGVPEEKGMWYESQEEILELLRWSRRKRRLMRWLNLLMENCLRPSERKYIEMYFIRCMSLREITAVMNINPSTVNRGIRRALRRLRRAARERKAIPNHLKCKLPPMPEKRRKRQKESSAHGEYKESKKLRMDSGSLEKAN